MPFFLFFRIAPARRRPAFSRMSASYEFQKLFFEGTEAGGSLLVKKKEINRKPECRAGKLAGGTGCKEEKKESRMQQGSGRIPCVVRRGARFVPAGRRVCLKRSGTPSRKQAARCVRAQKKADIAVRFHIIPAGAGFKRLNRCRGRRPRRFRCHCLRRVRCRTTGKWLRYA